MLSHSRARHHLLALLSYGLLSLILTYPLILHLTTHVPGDGIDDPALAWNLWWVRFSILNQHTNPFDCRWIFWPIGINLAFYTLTVLNGLLSIPLQLTFQVTLASNLLLLSSFVLSGYGAYLLARQVWPSASPAAAWLAGLVYAFASPKLFYAALGQFNIASSQWIPFCLLYVWRAAGPRGRARDAILAGLFLGLQAWAEATFASFLAIFIALYALWLAADSLRSRHALRQTGYTWARLALAGLIGVLLIIPMLANMLPDLRAEGDFFGAGGGFADVFSADVAGYLLPTQLHPLLGGLAARLPFPHDKGQHLTLGYTALALIFIGARARPRRAAAFWVAALLLFWLFTLGPTVRILGRDTGIPGPFVFVSELPFLKGNRYPSRYAVLLLACASLLVARGMAHIAQHWPPRRARIGVGLIALLFLGEHLSIPLPLSDLRAPALYHQIAATGEGAPGAVLELPLGWRNGARVVGKKDVAIMFAQWYQTVHQRPLLGGNTSRNPEFKFQYFSEAPLLDLLIALTNAADEPLHEALRAELAPLVDRLQSDPAWVAEQRRQAARVFETLNIAYVAVHRAQTSDALERYVVSVLPITLLGEEGDLALYRVDPALLTAYRQGLPLTEYLLASDLGHLVRGEGWGLATAVEGPAPAAVWAQRQEVRLQIPSTAGISALELLARAPGSAQEVALVIDGQEVERQPLPEEWSWVRFPWPRATAQEGLVAARLRFSRLYPAQMARDGITAVLAGQQSQASLVAYSAGEETGNFAHLYVNGVDHSPQRRGYNVIELDPASAEVVRAANFDTFSRPEEQRALAQWLSAVDPDHWVMGAVQDEGSLYLGDEGVAALKQIGVAMDLRGHFRWSHAFIGAPGLRPGEALEEWSGWRPAIVVSGAALTSPSIAAEVAAVRLVSESTTGAARSLSISEGR